MRFSRPRPDASDPRSDDFDIWVGAGMMNVAAESELLRTCDARLLRCYPSAPGSIKFPTTTLRLPQPLNSPRFRIG